MRSKAALTMAFSLLFATEALAQNSDPKPVYPIPTEAQMKWQKMEQYAMICFGMSTFNDLEWGYGDSELSVFDPVDGNIDVEQWARVCKQAGMKGILLVAKHHDGFCLWQSKYTDYGVKGTSWKDGKGDIVAELAAACKKEGLKLALYLSPWDRNHADYGKPEYVTYFHNQIREMVESYPDIFEYWFDGANGGDGYYGGAREKRTIEDLQAYYNYPMAAKMIKGIAPDAMIFGGTCDDIRWIGNEEGWAGATNWSTVAGADGVQAQKATTYKDLAYGLEGGSVWLPGETDVSIRPGWYYHQSEDNKVKSVSQLLDIYYHSVGRNSNLLLSFCPDKRGRIHEVDSTRAVTWWQTVERDLQHNILTDCSVEASSIRSQEYLPSKTIDTGEQAYDTFWATPDGVTTGTLTYNFGQERSFNRLLLQEYIPLGQRVAEWDAQVKLADGSWQPISFDEETTTIGYKRILRFKTVSGIGVRINFKRARGPLCINQVGAYLAPMLVSQPSIYRDQNSLVHITAGDKESEIYYTTNGETPQVGKNRYDKPFMLDKIGQVRAIAHDHNFKVTSAITTVDLNHPMGNCELVGNKEKRLFDGNTFTGEDIKGAMVIDLQKVMKIKGFAYTPNQGRWANGFLHRYEVHVGNTPQTMKKVCSGELSNIKNSPTKRTVTFPSVNGRFIKIVPLAITDDKDSFSIAEFEIIR